MKPYWRRVLLVSMAAMTLGHGAALAGQRLRGHHRHGCRASCAQSGPRFRLDDGQPIQAVVHNGIAILTLPPLLDIGRAKLHRLDNQWPTRLTIRTKAPALEGFGVNGSSVEAVKRKVDEYIEIEVPPQWTARNPNLLEIFWIDYYRG